MSGVYRETDLAWMAGIVDGEGSVMLSRNRSTEYRSPVLSVSNNSLAILRHILTLFNGCICTKKKAKSTHNQNYDWKISGGRAIELMARIVPYMLHTVKIYRIKHIVTGYALVTPRNGQYTEGAIAAKLLFEDEFFSQS